MGRSGDGEDIEQARRQGDEFVEAVEVDFIHSFPFCWCRIIELGGGRWLGVKEWWVKGYSAGWGEGQSSVCVCNY